MDDYYYVVHYVDARRSYSRGMQRTYESKNKEDQKEHKLTGSVRKLYLPVHWVKKWTLAVNYNKLVILRIKKTLKYRKPYEGKVVNVLKT